MTEIRSERLTACPLCGDRRSRQVCTGRDRQFASGGEAFAYSRCRRCDVVYQSRRPTEERIAAFYPDNYGPYQTAPIAARTDAGSPPQPPHFALRSFVRARAKRWLLHIAGRLNSAVARRYPDALPALLDRIYSPPHPGANLLDFGCGSPDFLDRARARGWNTLGADFAEPVVRAVRQAGHAALVCSPEMWEAIPDGSIDVVRMNHVIEHLYHPRETMARLRTKLRPGGRLHLATPNAKSLTFRLFGSRWFSLDCPRHIVLFSPGAVGRLLQRAGFARTTCYQEVLTKDLARSVGYLLQDCGRLDIAGVHAMMNRPALAACLFAPSRLSAMRGLSDRFHAVAVA